MQRASTRPEIPSRRLKPRRDERNYTAQRLALVVDDDPELGHAMVTLLANMDFDVIAASHYDEALTLLRVREPDLVCIDVGLPAQSGYDLCEYIRGPMGRSLVPILLMSDWALPQDVASAEEAGANAFLQKPFSMRELTTCVEALVTPERAAHLHAVRVPVRQ
jgi:DNA-binding response OmpR family regulator